MEYKIVTFSLRIDKSELQKFGYISSYEGRSKNRELLWMIRKKIAEFEKEHGKIEDDTGQDKKCQPH